ncbi:MAG: hypothetical protein ACR2LO_03735 [Ilumatobacteraceae bacterium]
MVDQTIFDTVRSYADAWAAGDLVGVLDAYDEDQRAIDQLWSVHHP